MLLRDFIELFLFAIAAPGVVGYLTVNALSRGELKALASNSLRGFITGAFICGCLGVPAIVMDEINHGTNLVSIFRNIVIFDSIMAFCGGTGGALAVWKRREPE